MYIRVGSEITCVSKNPKGLEIYLLHVNLSTFKIGSPQNVFKCFDQFDQFIRKHRYIFFKGAITLSVSIQNFETNKLNFNMFNFIQFNFNATTLKVHLNDVCVYTVSINICHEINRRTTLMTIFSAKLGY